MFVNMRMTERLLATDLFSQRKTDLGVIQWLLAEHPVQLIESQWGVSLGSGLTICDDAQEKWLMGMAQILVVSPVCQDMGLQKQGQRWVLWCYYDGLMDDQRLLRSLHYHLNMIYFLEQSRSCKPSRDVSLGDRL